MSKSVKGELVAKGIRAEVFKNVLSIAQKVIGDELILNASSSGILIRQMDSSHVLLINIELPAALFDEYTCPKDFIFSIELDKLLKLIGRPDKTDNLSLETAEDSPVNISIEGQTKANFKIHQLMLEDKAKGSMPLPTIKFNAKIELDPTLLNKLLDKLLVVSDRFSLTVKGDIVTLSNEGDVGNAVFELSTLGGSLLSLDAQEDIESLYSIEYITNLLSQLNTDKIKLEYNTKMPLKVTADYSGITIIFWLAPYIIYDDSAKKSKKEKTKDEDKSTESEPTEEKEVKSKQDKKPTQ